jgi:hypothetical protein
MGAGRMDEGRPALERSQPAVAPDLTPLELGYWERRVVDSPVERGN